jgi:hypothetical protein
MEICIRRIGQLLKFYKVPSQFFDENGEQKERESKAWIGLMAEALNNRVNRTLTDEPFDARVKEIIHEIGRTYKGRDWPQPHHFETAANTVAKKHQTDQPRQPAPAGLRDYEIAAERIKTNQHVDQCFIVPPLSDVMVNDFEVSQSQIDQYQRSAFYKMVTTYGRESAQAQWDQFVAHRKTFTPDPDDDAKATKADHHKQAIREAMANFQPVRA